MVNLGDKVKDTITGFEGVVTGTAEYITGCRQVCIVPPAKDGDYKPGQWFDDDRVAVLQASAVTLPKRQRDGGPQSHPAPTR